MKSLVSKLVLAHVFAALAATSFVVNAQSKEQHNDKEIKEDIARHRAMAAAHEGAAKCLEGGKGHDACQKDLQAACKGLGIGKYCGLRHAH